MDKIKELEAHLTAFHAKKVEGMEMPTPVQETENAALAHLEGSKTYQLSRAEGKMTSLIKKLKDLAKAGNKDGRPWDTDFNLKSNWKATKKLLDHTSKSVQGDGIDPLLQEVASVS